MDCDLQNEKSEARSSRKESPAVLDYFWNHCSDIITILNENGAILYQSPSISELLGYQPEEMIGKNVFDYIHPADWNRVGQMFTMAANSVENSGEIEFRFRHKNGHWCILLAHGENRKNDPDIGVVIVTSREVSDLWQKKEAFARLAAIAESSEDAIFSKTTDGVILTWNQAAQRIYGYAANEIIGKSVTELAPETKKDEVHHILKQISNGQSVKHIETVRRKKDGSLIYVSLTISPLWNPAGMITGASTVARDITNRKKAGEIIIESESKFRALF